MTTGHTKDTTSHRSGFVALIGRPNTGKSTFLNKVIGSKVSIVSEKPQTTRNRIRAVYTRDDFQIVFIDTPGIHKPKHKLGEYMVNAAIEAVKDVDAVAFFLDGAAGIGSGDQYVADDIKRLGGTAAPENDMTNRFALPVFTIVNKIDLIRKDKLPGVVEKASALGEFSGPYPVSSVTGEGIGSVLSALKSVLPQGPRYYPSDMITDYPEKFIIGEIIREKILSLTEQEVPHSVVVEVEQVKEREDKDILDIAANIYVERQSQKGILIGSGGRLLKEVGKQAREELESLLNIHVYLQLWVKYKKAWRKDERSLRRFGFYESD